MALTPSVTARLTTSATTPRLSWARNDGRPPMKDSTVVEVPGVAPANDMPATGELTVGTCGGLARLDWVRPSSAGVKPSTTTYSAGSITAGAPLRLMSAWISPWPNVLRVLLCDALEGQGAGLGVEGRGLGDELGAEPAEGLEAAGGALLVDEA